MPTIRQEAPEKTGWTSGECEQIRAQLERLLTSHHFNLSKRYPSLLRHLVESTLRGDTARLKERLIGVEVFERAPDYNTAEDPIVRITVAEVRKRIAQYYQEHGKELRIGLSAGSYVPVFRFASELETPAQITPPRTEPDAVGPIAGQVAGVGTAAEAEVAVTDPDRAAASSAPRRRALRWTLAACCVLALAALAAWRWLPLFAPSPVKTVWAPFLNSRLPILLCIGKPGTTPGEDTATTTITTHITDVNALTYDDVEALLGVTRILYASSHDFTLRSSAKTTFSDLQKGPVVFIGALDNPWTMRAMRSLRYQIEPINANSSSGIADHAGHETHDWTVNLGDPYQGMGRDYAIVARFQDSETDQTVMVIGGIGGDGTRAAGEFLTRPEYLKALAATLAQHKTQKNFEVVLGSQMVNGASGPPRVLATEIW
jgi:hypothetical protein